MSQTITGDIGGRELENVDKMTLALIKFYQQRINPVKHFLKRGGCAKAEYDRIMGLPVVSCSEHTAHLIRKFGTANIMPHVEERARECREAYEKIEGIRTSMMFLSPDQLIHAGPQMAHYCMAHGGNGLDEMISRGCIPDPSIRVCGSIAGLALAALACAAVNHKR